MADEYYPRTLTPCGARSRNWTARAHTTNAISGAGTLLFNFSLMNVAANTPDPIATEMGLA